jgi:hypothetical protein
MNSTLSADESALFLAGKLRRQEPFSFWRFGDGFLECVAGKKGGTCDGEQYDPALAEKLWSCWLSIVGQTNGAPAYLGDWRSASFAGARDPARYSDQYAAMIEDAGLESWQFLHFEALLLMRETPALIDFYRAVKEDKRRKLFMGPLSNSGVASLLGASCLATPLTGVHLDVDELTLYLLTSDFDILLFGAGMAGNIPAVRCWEQHPERTYINLGSALDPLGRGTSRKQQISPERARHLFGQI